MDEPDTVAACTPALPDEDLATRSAAPRVRASWRRSAEYGVPPDEVEPLFTAAVDTGSLLYECATEILTGLQSTIANEPVSLMVADRDGLVLARLCSDAAIRRSLDRVHLAPGFCYSERVAGTNGLGLSLADRAPSLVRAEDHYCTDLRGYTCAAVPVLHPVSGDLAGTINLTTWSDSSSDLLLALAQAAAGATTGLMLQRASGRPVPATPRGEVLRVVAPAREDDGDPCVSAGWTAALQAAAAADAAGRVVAVLGEPGTGKSTLAALARRRLGARRRILHARAPGGDGVAAWLDLWTPELRDPEVCVIVSATDLLPAWAQEQLAMGLAGARRADGHAQPFVLTAPRFATLPPPLARLVDTVVEVPPLRHRADDVLPLAHTFARSARRRPVDFSPRATRALADYWWPENVRQLRRVVREAVARADVVDVQHLAPEVLGGTRSLSRLERLERDEIIRCLTQPASTMARAAEELGIGRATLYRKIAQYEITIPGRTRP